MTSLSGICGTICSLLDRSGQDERSIMTFLSIPDDQVVSFWADREDVFTGTTTVTSTASWQSEEYGDQVARCNRLREEIFKMRLECLAYIVKAVLICGGFAATLAFIK